MLGHFSYADVTMAVALQAVEPVGPPISKYAQTLVCQDCPPCCVPAQRHCSVAGLL